MYNVGFTPDGDADLACLDTPIAQRVLRKLRWLDVLHLAISDEPEAGSVELGPNITVELNDKGEMIGIEILEASRFIRDSIMESVQARVLRVPEVQPA